MIIKKPSMNKKAKLIVFIMMTRKSDLDMQSLRKLTYPQLLSIAGVQG